MINPPLLPEKGQALQKRMYPDSLRPSGYIPCKPGGTISGSAVHGDRSQSALFLNQRDTQRQT